MRSKALYRKKVLWVPHAPWGVKQRAGYLANYLRESYELHVITWTALQSTTDLANPNRLRSSVHRFERQGEISIHHIPQIPGSLYSRGLRRYNDRLLTKEMVQVTRDNAIDVAIVSRPVALPDMGIPVIADFVDEHGSYWRDIRGRSDLAREVEVAEKRMAELASRIVVVSDELSTKIDKWGYEAVYVPNGYDEQRVMGGDRNQFRDQLAAVPGEVLVGYIGSFGEFSGLIRVIECAGLLTEENVRFVIAGAGSQLSPAIKLARQRNLPNVEFLGWLTDVCDFFAGIDIGLLPFDVVDFTSKACPIKLFEYIGAGKPTVSTKLLEVERMALPGVSTVDATPESMALGVRDLLSSVGQDVDHTAVERFRWERLASDMSKVIENLDTARVG